MASTSQFTPHFSFLFKRRRIRHTQTTNNTTENQTTETSASNPNTTYHFAFFIALVLLYKCLSFLPVLIPKLLHPATMNSMMLAQLMKDLQVGKSGFGSKDIEVRRRAKNREFDWFGCHRMGEVASALLDCPDTSVEILFLVAAVCSAFSENARCRHLFQHRW